MKKLIASLIVYALIAAGTFWIGQRIDAGVIEVDQAPATSAEDVWQDKANDIADLMFK